MRKPTVSATLRSTRPALLFIPDISGFTRFVKQTEIEHARHIIEELLEILIDTNEIGLELSEIEGDALLFYRFDQVPTAAELLAQVQRMYVNFQAHLRRYEQYRICQCGACSTAHRLSLKFVAHYGEITTKQVKEHSKLFGSEVIVAHRLLKNEIDNDEYVLLTHSLVNACQAQESLPTLAWAGIRDGKTTYDYGTTDYCYLPLSPLHSHVPEPQPADFSLPNATMPLFHSQAAINAPLEMVFNVVSDLSFRHHWQHSLIGSEVLGGRIAQEGAAHRCIIEEGGKNPVLVSHDFRKEDDMITFTDTSRGERIVTVFTLRRIGPALTRIEMHLFIPPNWFKKILFNLFIKKRFERDSELSWKQLDQYCRSLQEAGKPHSAQIVL